MLSTKSNIFIKEILSYVKFKYDRNEIRIELESHISDKMKYYTDQGYDIKMVEQLSINDMGDAKEIGMELNKQHNPIIGWLWRVTNAITVLFIIISFFILISFLGSFFKSDLIGQIPNSDIVYKINLKKQVKIDDRVIRFTDVIYENNGDMKICYESYDTRRWGSGWSSDYLGEISDNNGNKYLSGSGQQYGGIITRGIWSIDHFSKDADMLIISYDCYNRNYRVEIPLKEGVDNE